jgi:cysteine desulfurase
MAITTARKSLAQNAIVRNDIGEEVIVGTEDFTSSSEHLPVYLDNHATTPIDPRVAQLVFHTMTKHFGNAHSVDHVIGQRAAMLVKQAAEDVAYLLGSYSKNVRFTSGATEAIRIALGIAATGKTHLRVAVSRVEHKAVLEPLRCMEEQGRATLRWIDVDKKGQISIDQIALILGEGIDLLCLMAANNEVGTIYPIKDVAALATANGAEILVDATAAAGRVPIECENWGIDHLIVSAHKLYGPKGAGALIGPATHSQVAGKAAGHAGTLNVPSIVGFGEAFRLARQDGDNDDHATRLRDRLELALLERVPDLIINGDPSNRLGNNLHISIPGVPNDAVLSRLHHSVAISTGAACSSGAQEPSHVLRAMRLTEEMQESALRISTGKFNTVEEIDFAASEIAQVIAQIKTSMRML